LGVRKLNCEVWGTYSSVNDDSSLLGSDIKSIGE